VLGTRLAILSSLPSLKLIVIDEEHDPPTSSRKACAIPRATWRCGARTSWHSRGAGLGHASLETWHHAQAGRYRRLELRQRAAQQAVLPTVKVIDMERDKPVDGLTAGLIAAVRKRLEQGEQSLLFLNRRGYAPVLAAMPAAGSATACAAMPSWWCTARAPPALPPLQPGTAIPRPARPAATSTCSRWDAAPSGWKRACRDLPRRARAAHRCRFDPPEGLGPERLRQRAPGRGGYPGRHPDGGQGTRLQKLTLVGVLNPDTALFSHDYRASERLFAQLMQVAGRAGRAGLSADGSSGEVLIQTRYPHHPLYQAVMRHDYDGFAGDLLEERRQAHFPPFMYQALLRAEARELDTALGFLKEAAALLDAPAITINEPIPMTLMRVANVERAQLLIECPSRPALQGFLKHWLAELRQLKTRARWSLEVDPVDI
jgi:primosomal protein N' (replication factor Y)